MTRLWVAPRCHLRQNPQPSLVPPANPPRNLPPSVPLPPPTPPTCVFHVSPCCASPFAPPRPLLCLLQQPSPRGAWGGGGSHHSEAVSKARWEFGHLKCSLRRLYGMIATLGGKVLPPTSGPPKCINVCVSATCKHSYGRGA